MARPQEYDPKPVVLAYEKGLSTQEVADRYKMPVDTVRSILVREGVKFRPPGGDHRRDHEHKKIPKIKG